MPTIPEPKDQWYVVHVLSGQESKVRANIERRIEAEEAVENSPSLRKIDPPRPEA